MVKKKFKKNLKESTVKKSSVQICDKGDFLRFQISWKS